jgi:hypothetical protein
MAAPKTRPTDASVDDFIAAQPDPQRRADCHALRSLMQQATGCAAVLWGEAIVGFGAYAMAYADGSSQPWPLAAFSPRKGDISIYLMDGTAAHAQRLARLGRHKTGAVCLYLRRLSDADPAVLQELLQASVAAMAGRRIG